MTAVLETPLFTEDVPEKAAAKGHVRFTSKSLSPDDIALLGFCANVTASILFERMQAQGTNIILNLEKDNVRVDVVARHENDGLNLQWPPKAGDPNQLGDIQGRIRDKAFFIGREKRESKPQPVKAELATPVQKPQDEKQLTEEEEDYLVKQLHRIP